MNDEQPPLFDIEGERPAPKLAAKPPAARYARYVPRTRTLCDDCVAAIHELGPAVAPLPRTVRWRRTTASSTSHLCELHKDERQEYET